MKTIFMEMLIALMIMISFLSCSNEELFVEPITAVSKSDQNLETVAPKEDIMDASSPCDFELENVQPNSTLTINCVLDLQGKTINLPSNVTIDYQGGQIINGTINFSEKGIIEGDLLNSTFIIGGSKPRLKDPTFNFDIKRWGIVQGNVSDEVAISNRNIINKAINLTKELGGNTFVLNNIDAYFNVSTKTGSPRHDIEASIHIPSNFHFKMGEDCNLRVQPHSNERSLLIYSRSTENIKISGGKLWGDRYKHDYTTINSTHDWGHVIMLKGVHNSIIDGVEIHEGTGDGIDIAGVAHRFNNGSIKPDGRESKNITIKNCLIDDNRRNNISITDGTDIYIEYNTISNAGSGDDSSIVSSNGTSPRAGIDIEAFKGNAPENSVDDWERTEDIHIRNNIFEDNYAVDVVLYNGEKTYVYENTFRSNTGVSAAYGYNNKIYNNNFERPKGQMSGSQGLKLEPRYWANGKHRIKDFEVYGNTFSGYQFGIVAGGKNNTFNNNTMNDCQRGFVLITSEDLKFNDNIILSSVKNSYGYYTFSGEISIKNCLIKNGETNVQTRGLYFSNINNKTAGKITIDNVDFNGSISLKNAQNITVQNSTYESISITDCSPLLINNK